MEHLTDVQHRIIRQLHAAHVAGLPELAVRQLAQEVGLSAEEALSEVRHLVSAGICDRMDSEEVASLSATGLRLSRRESAVKSAEKGASEVIRERHSPGVEPTVLHLRRALEGWRGVVSQSNLAEEEKARLCALGDELFEHPAFFELVRRALIRVGGDVPAHPSGKR